MRSIQIDHIISLDNLFLAWDEFKRGKTGKLEVQEFSFKLEDNIFKLHSELKCGTWKPNHYTAFFVRDPKLRHIHKATVRDRVFNQALYRILYQIFDVGFIHDSYSCRKEKGTHRGVMRLENYIMKITKNYSRPAFALKCDVRKFFDNIDHGILFSIIKRKVTDADVLLLIKMILESFETKLGVGLPLGNVTSQLFANVYLNELDQFVKHILKAKYYLRYCDDFIILDTDTRKLQSYKERTGELLIAKLHLSLHPNKVFIRKCSQGIDFLGYVVLPNRNILRTKTRNRILKKIDIARHMLVQNQIGKEQFESIAQSYSGVLSHCAGHKIQQKISKIDL